MRIGQAGVHEGRSVEIEEKLGEILIGMTKGIAIVVILEVLAAKWPFT